MPVTQDRLTRLREFGLSEYAARSYLALLDLGIAEARDVSSISKVPQAKIYHVLEQLHDKGLVVILPEFPKKYAPVPFEEYLSRLYDEHKKAAQAIETERAELAEMFRVLGDTDVGDRGFFTVIRGRRNVLARIEEMIGQTQKDLVVLGTAGTAARAPHFTAELRRARERDVRVRILAPVDNSTIEALEPLSKMADLRARDLGEDERSNKVAIVISDSARAFLIHFVPDDSNLQSGKDIGVFTDQEAMVAAIQAIVEPHFVRAARYDTRRREIAEGRVAEFTRIYTSEEEARNALSATLKAGASSVTSIGWAEPQPAGVHEWRAIEDLTDTRAIDARAAFITRAPQLDVRHLRTPAITGQVIVDDREAFFRIGDVVLHTSAPPVIDAMRDHFEALWSGASTLDHRRHELQIFPGVQPGDIGIGRLFHLMRDAVLVADSKDRILLSNPAAEATFMRDAAAARGLDLAELCAPDARATLRERMRAFRRRGHPGDDEPDLVETQGVRANGEAFPMELTLSLLRTPEGEQYAVVVARDITLRRRAIDAEREANERVTRAYERMTEAFYALDRDFRFVYRNPAVRAMQRSRADGEIDGRVIWHAFPDLVGTKFESELRRAMAQKKAVTFEEYYPRMGAHFEVHAYPAEDGLSVYFRDITKIRRAEEALRATLDATPDGILVVSSDGRITGHNAKLREIWGVSAEELEGTERDAVMAAIAKRVDEPEAFVRRMREVREAASGETMDVVRFRDGRVFERRSKPQVIHGEIVGRVWSFREAVTQGAPPAAASARSR